MQRGWRDYVFRNPDLRYIAPAGDMDNTPPHPYEESTELTSISVRQRMVQIHGRNGVHSTNYDWVIL